MKGRKEKNISTQSIRRTLDKHGFHIGTSCRMPLLTKKNIKGKLVETCGVLEECFMEWCDQTGTFWPMDQEYVWCKTGKPYEQKNTISMLKHGGGPVLLWGCFAVAGNGNRDCMKNIMDSLEYQAILAMIRMSSVQRLKLDVQQDSHPKVYIQIYLCFVQGLVIECPWVTCSIFRLKFHWKYLVEFEESSNNMKTKDYQWSASFFKWGMGQDCNREVTEESKHLQAVFIGFKKRFCTKFDFWVLNNVEHECLEPI